MQSDVERVKRVLHTWICKISAVSGISRLISKYLCFVIGKISRVWFDGFFFRVK